MSIPIKMFSHFKEWTGPTGLIQDAPGRHGGNGCVHTSDFIACCRAYAVAPPKWAADLLNSLEDKENPGLLFRLPGDRHAFGHEGPDNVVARLNAGRILNDGYPARFLKYMRQTGWVFNNREPGKWRIKSDFSRFGHLGCHAQWCAGERPGLVAKIWWCVATLITAFKSKDQNSDKCIQLHMNDAARGKWVWSDLVINIFQWRMKKQYGAGWGQLRAAYFQHARHPISIYMLNRW